MVKQKKSPSREDGKGYKHTSAVSGYHYGLSVAVQQALALSLVCYAVPAKYKEGES